MNIRKLFIPLLLSVTLAGCGGGQEPGQETHSHTAPNGDLRETTASTQTLPEFLEGKQELIRNAYLVAAQNADVLEWMPCYCGCGESAGHQSNLNCFIHEIREDGTVEWDDHGTRCNVCIQIAVESAVMHKQGKSLQDIRNAIDESYGTGLAAPTPTPMPL